MDKCVPLSLSICVIDLDNIIKEIVSIELEVHDVSNVGSQRSVIVLVDIALAIL